MLLFFLLLALCLNAAAAPQIAIEPEELDMGRVKTGEFSEKPLTVKNLGDTPLVIERIITSCPCVTVVPLPAEAVTIPPGGSVGLTVRYKPDERAGDSGAAVAIYSNDPAMPAVVTDLGVFIEVLVMIDPPDGVHWGLAPRGFPVSEDLTIAPGDSTQDIELLSVSCSAPGVAIEAEKVEQADRRYLRLTFSLSAELQLGMLDAVLNARVRVGEEVAEYSIPFRGHVLGDQFLSPPAIISPRTAYAQGQKISEISVRSSTDGPSPSIVGAMAVGPVKAMIDHSAEADSNVIGVFAAENAPRGPQSGTVYVMTTSKDEPITGVPIYFRMGSTVVCEPDHLVLHEDGSPQEIRVRHSGGDRVSIKKLRFETDSLRAEIREATQDIAEDPAIVSVGPAEQFNPEKRSTILVVETDVPGAEQLTIPILILP